MDRDHLQMLALINQFDVHASQGQVAQALSVLQQLCNFSVEHETREEALLSRTDCPMLKHMAEQHEQAHVQLVFRANKLRHRPSQALMEAISAYLQRWFVEHVVQGDLPLRSWFVSQSRPAKQTPYLRRVI
jgi:hemerythrin-like metal-binding protein